jgi:hypothetical protein
MGKRQGDGNAGNPHNPAIFMMNLANLVHKFLFALLTFVLTGLNQPGQATPSNQNKMAGHQRWLYHQSHSN